MSHTSDLPFGYPATKRSKLRLNVGWRFHLGDVPEAAQADFDDSAWETVHLPHTLKLTSLNLDGCQDDKTQPTFHREVGWYRRAIEVDPDPERLVFLEFEGAHQVTDCWVNGLYVEETWNKNLEEALRRAVRNHRNHPSIFAWVVGRRSSPQARPRVRRSRRAAL